MEDEIKGFIERSYKTCLYDNTSLFSKVNIAIHDDFF